MTDCEALANSKELPHLYALVEEDLAVALAEEAGASNRLCQKSQ